MKSKGMWILVSVLVVLGLLMSGFGCAAPAPEVTPTPTPKPTPTPTPTPKPTPTPTPTPKPTPAPAKVFTMKVSGYGGASDYPPRAVLEHFMKIVEERAGGQVKFEYFPASSLYGLEDGGRAITPGVIQLSNISLAYFRDQIGARSEAYMAPMTTDWKNFNANYRKGYLPWLQEVVGPALNWKVLWYSQHGTTNITARVPIRTPADFKGKLIRSTAAQKRALELIGASPILMAGGATTFEALQRGTVDGTTGSIASSISLGWLDVAPYAIYIDMYPAAIGAVMPLDYYNGLPSDLRQIIDDATIEADSLMTPLVEEFLKAELETLKAMPKVEAIIFTTEQLKQLGEMLSPYHVEMKNQWGIAWFQFVDIVDSDHLGP